MGRHLIRALTHDGLDEGSQSTKYTQVALKKGTSLGPSLFTTVTGDTMAAAAAAAAAGTRSGLHHQDAPRAR